MDKMRQYHAIDPFRTWIGGLCCDAQCGLTNFEPRPEAYPQLGGVAHRNGRDLIQAKPHILQPVDCQRSWHQRQTEVVPSEQPRTILKQLSGAIEAILSKMTMGYFCYSPP